MFDASSVAGDGVVALRLLLFSVSLHYLQNISSIYFLAHVSVLSHQVAQSLKRLMVIACSVFYFRTPVTPLNVVRHGVGAGGLHRLLPHQAADARQQRQRRRGREAHSAPGRRLRRRQGARDRARQRLLLLVVQRLPELGQHPAATAAIRAEWVLRATRMG